MINHVLKWLAIILGAVFFLFIHNYWLYKFLVPDPCYYHFHEPHIIMELFYDFGESSNNHPEPNLFNIIITLFLGGIFGYYSYRIINLLIK